MTEADLINVVFQIRDQINFLWNFYVTACAILIGWLFSESMTWSKDKFYAICGLFFVFALINLSAINTEYGLLETALSDLSSKISYAGGFSNELANTPGMGSLGAVIIHVVVDLLLLQLIRYRYRRKRIDTQV